MRMSESDVEIMCSQVSTKDFSDTQSYDYGEDIIGDQSEMIGNVVSLESGNSCVYNVGGENQWINSQNARILYDNVMIEDISSDDELDKL